jgi:serine/threonine protein kinase
MSLHFAHPSRRPSHSWSSRTADLDGSTQDIDGRSGQVGDRTEDIFTEATDDVDVTRRHSAGSKRDEAGDELREEPRIPTLDLAQADSASASAMAPPRSNAISDTVSIAPDKDVAAASEERIATAIPAATVAPVAELTAGTILAERYLIEATLGSGGTAFVYRARDLHAPGKTAPNARLAIKVPRIDGAQRRSRAVTRLQHEYRHAQQLTHPNIVRVLELQVQDTTAFMTMELVEGQSLATLLKDWRRLSAAAKHSILRACADALSYAHEHEIVHGDFKPANVLVTRTNAVKVFDFGASGRIVASSDNASNADGSESAIRTDATQPDPAHHGTRIPAGTPAYASPQILNGEEPDRRDDVFSFACVAYELLTGQHPFERRSSLEAREQGIVPPRAWSLMAPQWLALLGALSWEREQRPSDVASLAAALLADRGAITPATREPQPLDTTPPSSPDSASASGRDLTEAIVAPQRGWGFFAFVAVAVTVTLFLFLRDDDDEVARYAAPAAAETPQSSAGDPYLMASAPLSARSNAASIAPTALSPVSDRQLTASAPLTQPGGDLLPPRTEEKRSFEQAESSSAPSPAPARTPPAVSTIGFETPSVVTSESAIAAVFIVTRTPPLSGRTTVHWEAKSGTAKAGEDFIGTNGVIDFGDGQSRRAIYIPLRNDTEAEGDETFTVQLVSATRGRIGPNATVEATILDDD